jgi:hypothetical protein
LYAAAPDKEQEREETRLNLLLLFVIPGWWCVSVAVAVGREKKENEIFSGNFKNSSQ